MPQVSLARAQAAKKAAVKRFGGLAPVTGVGITRVDGAYAVKVNLSEPVERGTLPSSIDGVRLCVEVIGRIRRR